MSNQFLLTLCVASLTACIPIQEEKIPTMQQFPAPVQAPELEAAQPAIARAFAEAYPQLEVVKLAPLERHWDIGRNEVTGIVMRRGATFHLEFRKDGHCYYAVPIFWEEHVDAAWEAPRLVRFQDPYHTAGNVLTENVDGIQAAPLPCEGAPEVAATPR
jgi:hypothetical protein